MESKEDVFLWEGKKGTKGKRKAIREKRGEKKTGVGES